MDAEGRVRRRLRVSGRVQGVFYRASAEREAVRLGVAGFVRNERDGSVTVEIEGRRAAVATMEAWCAAGPPRAEVTKVEASDVEPLGSAAFGER